MGSDWVVPWVAWWVVATAETLGYEKVDLWAELLAFYLVVTMACCSVALMAVRWVVWKEHCWAEKTVASKVVMKEMWMAGQKVEW